MGKESGFEFPVVPFMLAAGVAAAMILAGHDPVYSLAVATATGVGVWLAAVLFLVLIALSGS